MTTPTNPMNLGAFQEAWRDSTAAPLRFLGKGAVEVSESDYRPELMEAIEHRQGLGPAARLGAYRQQYWFRLFTTMQNDFPLAGHLIGWEAFNPLVDRYLRKHPPGRNLTTLGAKFPSWLREFHVDPLLVEACRVDAAWSRTFHAPQRPAPGNEHLDALREGRLDLAIQPCVQVLDLRRDWFSIRPAVVAAEPVAKGAPPATDKIWVLGRQGRILSMDPVDPELGKILEAMRRGSGWMNVLERAVTRNPQIASKVGDWFALGTLRRWWALS